MTGFKLFARRRDGSLGPLFINRRQRLELGKWYPAEDHPTKGYTHRPGWHACAEKRAPHLRQGTADRVWARVSLRGVTEHRRPEAQGGLWYTARAMRIEEVLG